MWPHECDMGILDIRIIQMCNWSVKITLYTFEGNYDLKGNKIWWKIFAEKVRDIMAKCLGIPKV